MRYLYIAILFFFGGCIELKEDKGLEIPLKPGRDPEFGFSIQKSVDIIDQISHKAKEVGISANTHESRTLAQHADVVQLAVGLPSEPVDYQDAAESQALLEKIRSLNHQYDEKVLEWEHAMRELSLKGDENKRIVAEHYSLKKKFQTWLTWGLVIIAVITFLCPTAGVGIVKFLVRRARKAANITISEASKAMDSQFKQVVNALEDAKKDLKEKDPQSIEIIKKHLMNRTDDKTKDYISRVKGGVL